jgi:Family of unknown function (DUF6056)
MLKLFKTYRGIGFFLLAVFVLMFTLNQLTPLWGDDWYRTEPPNFEFFSRIKAEYLTWTGRVSVLLLTFILFWMYPGSVVLFNVINTVVFCSLLVGIFLAATGRYPKSWRLDGVTLFVALVSIWFFTQGFGEAILWKTGAIAYLWVITAAIFLLNPFVSLMSESRVVPDTRQRIVLLPIAYGFLALSLENVSVAMLVMMAFALGRARWLEVKLPRWYVFSLLAQLIGTVILLAAPGNFVRVAAQSDGIPMTRRLGDLLALIWQHGTTITPVFIVIAALLLLLAVRTERLVLPRLWCWFLFGLLLALAMIGSTGVSFQERTAFVAEVCFVIVVVGLAHAYWQSVNWAAIWPLPVIGIITAIFLADVSVTLEQYLSTWQQEQRREQLMDYYRAAQMKNILLPSTKVPYIQDLCDDIIDKRYFLRDIHNDIPGNGWRNGTYAKYHGFDFALRVEKPYMIYLPEINDTKSGKIWARGRDYVIFVRQERSVLSAKEVIYLFTPAEYCSLVTNLVLTLADTTKNTTPVTIAVPDRQDVAIVAADGKPDTERCAARIELPAQEFKRIEFVRLCHR